MRFAFTYIAALTVCGAAWGQGAAEYNARGVELYNGGEFAAAALEFEKANRLAPEDATIRRNLANAYQAHANDLAAGKDVAGAIAVLLKAIAADPENARPLVQLGAYYLQEALVPEAIFRLEEAIELAPKDVDAHYLLGEAYYRDNDVSAALDQWEWVYAVDPERPGLVERIERALREEAVEYDFAGDASRNFNVTFDRNTQWSNVKAVLQILEGAYRDIGRQLGHAYPPAPIQVTLYTADGFSEATQMGDHVGGLFDGTKIRVPVLDKDGKAIEAGDLKRRLVHEYVHVVVRHIAKDSVPWWLNEGLAETLSRELGAPELQALRAAKAGGGLFPLAELQETQLSRLGPEELSTAYRQAHATVAFLRNRHGMGKISAFLRELAAGADAESALRTVFRYTYRTLELAVAASIGNG